QVHEETQALLGKRGQQFGVSDVREVVDRLGHECSSPWVAFHRETSLADGGRGRRRRGAAGLREPTSTKHNSARGGSNGTEPAVRGTSAPPRVRAGRRGRRTARPPRASGA